MHINRKEKTKQKKKGEKAQKILLEKLYLQHDEGSDEWTGSQKQEETVGIKGEKHFLEGLIHPLSSMKRSNKLFVRNFRRVSTSKLTKTTIVPVGLVLCQPANVYVHDVPDSCETAAQIKHPWESRILL